ncbi:NAD(P)-binding protein [Paraphaeosphaeria sporulosa]|uniref:NAD(P)-binding protein n=1 Tax=Paraphaeosphaeria sporulosa TaxID=1460663 RepID=A0A177C462_9PLEO|nr:NAD(P)-binding protein [Paraphaeosphaeria sporulosa]OAG01460.1 NAD(P)-binding protein [Paraphaeosphaeria sporulosa]
MPRTILVTGATGRQGGAVVKALRDTDFEILALTRSSSSPSAQKLANSSPKIKLIEGDLDNTEAMFRNAKAATNNPIWGVYSVQAQVKGDVTIEETWGKNLIDSSIAAGVEFFVYSSVDRGGEKSSSTPTDVPHWMTKHNLEKYLEEKAAGTQMRFAVLRPVAFMENVTNDFAGKAMAATWQYALKNKPMQLVATEDIGNFAAEAFKHPEKYTGRYLSIAGAELTFEQANAVFKEKVGMDMPRTFGFVACIGLVAVPAVGKMFNYLKKNATGASVEESRKIYPGLMDFGTWLEKESQFRKQ